jgi:hypothetical protein
LIASSKNGASRAGDTDRMLSEDGQFIYAKLQSAEKELREQVGSSRRKVELEARLQRQAISEKRNVELTVSRRVAEEREKIRDEVLQSRHNTSKRVE